MKKVLVVLAVVGAVSAQEAPLQSVHVANPTQGMELVLFTAGFLVGAYSFRMLVGRW